MTPETLTAERLKQIINDLVSLHEKERLWNQQALKTPINPFVDEIENKKTANGQSVDLVEQRMRKRGYLSQEENLVDILRQDQQIVNRIGLTHAEIVQPLQATKVECGERAIRKPITLEDNSNFDFTFKGKEFEVKFAVSRGITTDPFLDVSKNKKHDWFNTGIYTIKDKSTGESLVFSPIQVSLIGKYGFYRGEDSCYLSPLEIVNFFVLANQAKSPIKQ